MDRLLEMVRLSVRVTHVNGNRRYEDFVFNVVGGEIIDVSKIEQTTPVVKDCETCGGDSMLPVFDECSACEGQGCPLCDEGLVRAWIPCPICNQSPVGKMRGSFDKPIG